MMRKHWNKVMAAALVLALAGAQPVWAASPVLAAGEGGGSAAVVAELVGPGGETGLMEEMDPAAPGGAEAVDAGAASESVGLVEIGETPVPIETAETGVEAGPKTQEAQEAGAGTEAEAMPEAGAGTEAAAIPETGAGPEAAAPETGAAVDSSPVIEQGAGKTLEEVRQPDAGQEAQPTGDEAQSAESEAQPTEGEAQLAEGEALQPAEEEAAGRQVDPSRPMVALTYDDGPQPSVGNRIMDCVAPYDGKVTFFMVGDRVPSHAAEVQRMVAEGHEVANHTLNHKYLQKLGAGEIQAQVNGCNDVIQQVSGVRPTLMRLPGGNQNATVRANTHMPMIQWSIDTLDWKTRNADSTVAAVLNQVQDGDIILMHELYGPTADATERIVPELVNRGFQLVTVSEMAAAKGISLQPGQVYSAFH